MGIIRAGALVEVAGVTELRRLRRTQVEATVTGDLDLSGVAGVSSLERIGPSRLRFSLTGPPGPALRALAAADVTALTVREPTLEEIFLEFYGTDVHIGGPVATGAVAP